jgi:DNA-binding IclR family transcriptional regulator
MARCGFVKEDGRPCECIVKASQEYCYSHDPERASERKRNSSRGGKRAGRGRPVAELAALRDENAEIRRRLLEDGDDKLSPGVAAVAVQSINTDIRAVSAALKAREAEELEARLEELERVLEQVLEQRGSRWGA